MRASFSSLGKNERPCEKQAKTGPANITLINILLDFPSFRVHYSRKEGFFMLNLTPQERRVILFLIGVALLGLGINFALKVNSRITKFIQVDNHITKININKANFQDLLSTPGISPKLAKNIVAYRNTKGAFKDIEELKEIRGIGDYRYDKLKDLFFVE